MTMESIFSLWRHGERNGFWALVAMHLLPIWAFTYLPTQDGPSHLDNAQILKGLVLSSGDYDRYFEIRPEPIPNWTSHAVLAALLFFMPAWLAEKILVSLYVIGFAGAFRYFLGAFGQRHLALSWLGLLFIYNRCLWMGFYNYCLSLILIWLIVGYCVRRRGELRWTDCMGLAVLFPLAYFTHLVGFSVALIGALAASFSWRPRQWLAPVYAALAALPSCFLTLDYFETSGFFRDHGMRRLANEPLAMARRPSPASAVGTQIVAIDQELFEHHAGGRSPLSLLLIPFFLAFPAIAAGEWAYRRWLQPPLEATEVVETGQAEETPIDRGETPTVGWVFAVLLGLMMLALYLLVANDIGGRHGVLNHGGYLKARLALLPPLVWLACLREPATFALRLGMRGLMLVLVSANLFLVVRTFEAGNDTISRFTAGVGAVGSGHRLGVIGVHAQQGLLANPLVHGCNYYCLGTGNLSLANYEAATPHFPIRYRQGVRRTGEEDVLIYWQSAPGAARPDWEEIFAEGPLRIYRRRDVGALHADN